MYYIHVSSNSNSQVPGRYVFSYIYIYIYIHIYLNEHMDRSSILKRICYKYLSSEVINSLLPPPSPSVRDPPLPTYLPTNLPTYLPTHKMINFAPGHSPGHIGNDLKWSPRPVRQVPSVWDHQLQLFSPFLEREPNSLFRIFVDERKLVPELPLLQPFEAEQFAHVDFKVAVLPHPKTPC